MFMYLLKKYSDKRLFDTYADFGEGRRIYDYQIAEFLVKHLKFWDWFNPYKIVAAASYAFYCLQEFNQDTEKLWAEGGF